MVNNNNFSEVPPATRLDKIKDLMTCIIKNTVTSNCITRFGELLNEATDENAVKIVMADMNKAIEEMLIVFKSVNKLDDRVIMSKILTYDFIKPERFFKKTVVLVNKYLKINAAINAKYYHNDPAKAVKYDVGNKNRLGTVWTEQFYRTNDPMVDVVLNANGVTDDNLEAVKENCRKVILLWNYCPTIVKAFLQTKRRNLGFDSNSTKF